MDLNKHNSTLHGVQAGCSTCPGTPQLVMLVGSNSSHRSLHVNGFCCLHCSLHRAL